jgi:hypothetical protein
VLSDIITCLALLELELNLPQLRIGECLNDSTAARGENVLVPKDFERPDEELSRVAETADKVGNIGWFLKTEIEVEVSLAVLEEAKRLVDKRIGNYFSAEVRT